MGHIRKITNLLPQPVRFGARRMLFRGAAHTCVLCGNNIREYRGHGGGAAVLEERQVVGGQRREATRCPVCHGADRTRMIMAYLETHIKVSWGERSINYLGSWASLVGLLIALISMFWPSEAYHIKILVLDEDGAHAKGTTVKAPPGKVVARDNYWALSIPRDEVPTDGRVRVTAQNGQGYDEITVELTHRKRFSINLKLRYPNALMKGVVLGPDGNPAGGVQITVFEHEKEAVLTSEDGTFSLPAHKAVGEEVRVTAKKGTWGRVGVYEAGRHNEIRLIDRSASD